MCSLEVRVLYSCGRYCSQKVVSWLTLRARLSVLMLSCMPCTYASPTLYRCHSDSSPGELFEKKYVWFYLIQIDRFYHKILNACKKVHMAFKSQSVCVNGSLPEAKSDWAWVWNINGHKWSAQCTLVSKNMSIALAGQDLSNLDLCKHHTYVAFYDGDEPT